MTVLDKGLISSSSLNELEKRIKIFSFIYSCTLVHEGPFLGMKASHVLVGKLKWAAQAFSRLFNVSSLNSNETNSGR